MGGARTLCTLLHSSNERLIFEAAMTISYIVSDSENNRKAIADDEGYCIYLHCNTRILYISVLASLQCIFICQKEVNLKRQKVRNLVTLPL